MSFRVLLVVVFSLCLFPPPGRAADPFAKDNLVAWCIVPFDGKKRGPEERVEMMKRLGFKKYAYDWRAEHLPTFERELIALKKHDIELTAVWFPAGLNADAKVLLDALAKHKIKTQLWVSMGGGGPAANADEQRKKVEQHAAAIRPIAEAAAKIGCSVGLYNHGSWFGEPENQLAIRDALKLPNVGIVYNQHHGHDHLGRFKEVLAKMKPHLLALNLNGMIEDGEKKGKKILPLGQGDLDLKLLKTISESGYTGPIGILGHTNDDAEERLQDNLDGLNWLLPQLAVKAAGPKPKPRTMAAAAAPTAGWLAEGKAEYRTPPLTAECRVKVNGKGGFNILLASDTKASAAHWELFTWPGNGHLTVYMPGMKPDHVRSTTDVADKQFHNIAMQYEANRVRLIVDGKTVADQEVTKVKTAVVPGGFGFARLVEGGIGCDGELVWSRLSKGIVKLAEGDKVPAATDATVGLWKFEKAGSPAEDLSPLKNPSKVAAAGITGPVAPSPGPHLKPVDPRLKVVLIDRSQDDAYMAVKADGAGRLFVGGREAVFVFEPDGRGGFLPRKELLRFPQDSIIIGLEYRGDDLYVQTVNALYHVAGGRTKREGLSPKRLLWGVPQDLHVSFHCLAWGPQGDLYLDHGDPLLQYGDWTRPDHFGHWTLFPRPDGTKVPYTGSGAVLRVRPDGSQLKVVAGGLRGPVGLAFDRNWELFTNDNDHESRPDRYAPCRLLHVTPHADFGWPRGWMASKDPDRADLLEPVNSVMGRGVPCDQIVYEEPQIPSLRGNLLLCRWDRMAVTRFPLKPRGASFEAEELPFLTGDSNARPTGITADRAGRLFVTSHYLGGNVVTPHCVSDLVMIVGDGPNFLGFDETAAPTEKLLRTLSHPSGEARRRVHNELLRRGGEALTGTLALLDALPADDHAIVHLPWLAAAAGGKAVSAKLIEIAKTHSRAEVRLQAIRALIDHPTLAAPRDLFVAGLADPLPSYRLAALSWFFDAPGSLPVEAVAKLAAESDTYMRQTATQLLARRATLADLDKLIQDSDSGIRRTAILAAGLRLTVPPIHDVPPKELPLSYPKGNAFFHRELRFVDADKLIDLADLGRIGSYTAAQRWASVTPSAEQETLFTLLSRALDDRADPVRSQAAYFLGLLRDPRSEPKVEQTVRALRSRGLTELKPVPVATLWLAGPFLEGSKVELLPESGPIDLADARVGWRKADAPFTLSGSGYAYFRIQSRVRQPALLSAAARVWHNGRPTEAADAGAVLLDLQPGSNDILLRATVTLTVSVRAKDPVTTEAPEKTDAGVLAARLREAGGAVKVGPEFLAIDWVKEARTGDAERGRKLFGTLSCAKCHAVAADQTGGGAPSLADVSKRFTPTYLVESILTPDRLVADGFRATRISTADGQLLTGLVVRESGGEVEILLPDTTRKVVRVGDIEERKAMPGSPMPGGVIRTPAELRDVLTYLLGDRVLPP